MAVFKVGDKVRVRVAMPALKGREGIVTQIPGAPSWEYVVHLPGTRHPMTSLFRTGRFPESHWGFYGSELEPVVRDSAADRFIASIKSLGPLKGKEVA